MKTYFIHDGHTKKGPFTFNELKNLELSKGTPVWFEGLSEWTTAENVPELSSLLSVPPTFSGLNTQSPPELVVSQYEPVVKKAFAMPIAVGAGITIVALVGWLIYSNKSQAIALEQIKQEQQIHQQQQQLQKQEQQKVDFAVQKLEEDKLKEEAKKKRKAEELDIQRKFYRNNWHEFITLEKNKYTYNDLGGIYNLKLNVTNRTDYEIDEVTAQIVYIKTNGDVWKTIEVPIYSIGSNSNKVEPIPDVERSTSVEIQITGIRSKAMQFCYAPGNWANNSKDPYLCD